MEWTDDLSHCISRIRQARKERTSLSLGYCGNVVSLWYVYLNNYLHVVMLYVFRQRLVKEYEKTGELLVELGSDQTSLHNPYGGGYYPVQLSFDEGQQCLKTNPERFKELVQERCVG